MGTNLIERFYCNTCKIFTKHENIFNKTCIDKIGNINYYQDINVWSCRGCETITFSITFYNDNSKDVDGNMIKQTFITPPRQSSEVQAKRFLNLPTHLVTLYNEVIISFNTWCFILTSIGLRSLLEGICKDKGILGATLEKRIDNMNFISESIKKNLHGIRFMGNDAAHDLDSLSRDEILIAIEIMEDVMNYTYELDYKSSRMLQIMNNKHELKENNNVIEGSD